MDGFPLTGLSDFGLGGLVTLGLLLIMFGRLIPRPNHLDRISDKNAQIQYLQEALTKRDEQLDLSLKNNELVAAALESIRREAARR